MRFHVIAYMPPGKGSLYAQRDAGTGLIKWARQPGEPLSRPQAADLAARASTMIGRPHGLIPVLDRTVDSEKVMD